MPRYIDADELMERIGEPPIYTGYHDSLSFKEHQLLVKFVNSVKEFINKIPTADVAPKSEVAREIFAEIERTLPNDFPFLGTAVAVYLSDSELKKKYIGEQK